MAAPALVTATHRPLASAFVRQSRATADGEALPRSRLPPSTSPRRSACSPARSPRAAPRAGTWLALGTEDEARNLAVRLTKVTIVTRSPKTAILGRALAVKRTRDEVLTFG